MLRRSLLLLFLLLPLSLSCGVEPTKWKLTLATMDNCGPCRALKDGFESDPNLKKLKVEFDFKVRNIDHEEDKKWFEEVGTPIRVFPKLVVQTPEGKTTAILSRKLHEKSEHLAERIRDAIAAHDAKHALLKQQQSEEERLPLIHHIIRHIFHPVNNIITSPVRNWLSCCSLFPLLALTGGAAVVIMVLVRTFLPNGVQKK